MRMSTVKRISERVVVATVTLSCCLLAINVSIANTNATDHNGPLWLQRHHQQSPSNSSSFSSVSKELDLVLRRIGPNSRASSNYHDYQDVNLTQSLEAWRLLRSQVEKYANNQVKLLEFGIKQLLLDANVSIECTQGAQQVLDSIKRLDAWAIKMWSSTGNFPPTGVLDGHFTDLGSFRGCVDLERKVKTNEQDHLEYGANYCIVGFRPIVPTRIRFHQIFEKERDELIYMFDKSNVLSSLLEQAQYFHYLYLKTGTCVPSECSPGDIQQVTNIIAHRLALTPAPVKCFTKSVSRIDGQKYQLNDTNLDDDKRPILIVLTTAFNEKQIVALILVATFFILVFCATIWHAIDLLISATKHSADKSVHEDGLTDIESSHRDEQLNNVLSVKIVDVQENQTSTLKHVAFQYLSAITNAIEFYDTSIRSNEIQCLHGFRVLTMMWIVCVHTLQYNEWSGFMRVFENLTSLQNPLVHPIINANYVVDNFFLMSGLLVAYTTWYSNKGGSTNFNPIISLLGRYLRLTPQVLLVSLLYILLPLIADGPFWYDMTHYASKYCEKNWWVNLLHAQAFYNEDEMCNLVGWWISVDMVFYVISLLILYLILNKHIRAALISSIIIVTISTLITAWRHYSGGFEPNNLGTVPQVNEVWTEFVVKFFWSPYPHAFVFFLGLWIGYVLANKKWIFFVKRNSNLGWILSIVAFTCVSYSSRLWTTGTLVLGRDGQLFSTAYNVVCVILWACSFGWMIVACHYKCAPLLNKILSTKVLVMISKASFIIYLSHMLVLRLFFGSRYNVLEVSLGTLTVLMVTMNVFSIAFGVFLCITFEGPCMKFQRFVLNKLKSERKLPVAGSSYSKVTLAQGNDHKLTTPLGGPTGVTLLK